MDLGATVCFQRRPACASCPWRERCVARTEGRPEAYPVKTRRLKRGRREHSLLLLTQGERLWLVQRPAPGVWAGLWSLPEYAADAALQEVAARGPGEIEPLAPVSHTLTHFDWQLKPWHWRLPVRLAAASRQRVEAALPAGRWFSRDEALAAGLPAPVRRLIDRLG